MRWAIVLKRILTALPALFGVVVATFLMTRTLPGDPAAFFAGYAATPESVEEVRKHLGLDRSWPEQFLSYCADLARGDFGNSVTTGRPVRLELWERMPASLELTLCGLFLALALGLPMGIVSALRAGSPVDHLCRTISTAGVSLPTFFTGLLLVYLFYFQLNWFPAPMGRLSLFTSAPGGGTGFYLFDALVAGNLPLLLEAMHHIALPAFTLGLFALAPVARMTRAALLGVLTSDFIRTARAAELPGWKILGTYALRNALLPVVTTLGMVFSYLLGANVLVEKVFSWPGVGSYALEALMTSDYAPVQGFVLTMGVLYVGVNLAIDIAYGFIDPRARVEA